MTVTLTVLPFGIYCFLLKLAFFLRDNLDGLCNHLRFAPRVDIFKLSGPAAAGEICELVQVGSDELMFISLIVCIMFNSQSSPWFSAASAAAIVHRNHFFHLYQ